MKPKIKNKSLYLLITEKYGCGRNALEIAERAIAGGVDIIQMREKDKPRADLLDTAQVLKKLCKKSGVLFIVNDDPILAKEADADGVHLGQKDAKLFIVNEARSILGDGKIIGLSTGSIEEIEAANKEDVDYIGFGPVFHTQVKKECVGCKDVKKALKISKKPVFFIGGINPSNIDELLDHGAKNVAVMNAIIGAEDITAAAKNIKLKL